MQNYYDILEIKENASIEVIKAAYKTLAKKYHPDNWSGQEDFANQKFVEIGKAYEVLSDEQLKKQYDEKLRQVKNTSSERTTQTHDAHSYEGTTNKHEDKTQKPDGPVMSLVKAIGKSIRRSWEKAQQEFDEAYFEGLKMSDYILVHDYRKATGFKRAGYAKAMEERGFLRRNTEGKLVATDKMKDYW